MGNELVVKYDLASLRDSEELQQEFFGLPDLEKAVLTFIRLQPDKLHIVLSPTQSATRDLILRHIPSMDPSKLQVVHPFTGTIGLVSNGPDVALSSLVVLNDANAYNQVCCRLRHHDSAYYVWADFEVCNDVNGPTVRAMSPHLFRKSVGHLHLYTGLKDLDLLRGLPSPETPKFTLGTNHVQSLAYSTKPMDD